MTRAEREKLIEEKNRILGQQKDSQDNNVSVKRKLFFNSNSIDKDKKEENESNLTEAEKALLKVCNHLNLLFNILLGKILRHC